MKKEDTQKFKITKKGSLGLLAYGDIGLRAWRKVKNYSITNENNLDTDEKE